LWPDKQKNQIADWLFSKDFDSNGQPKGIGLSMWRFNIGAGSDEQENIADVWRRAQCFLKKDGTYDWTRQKGQQWFLSAARERRVESYLAFTNSPPVYFTRNGYAFSSNGQAANLARDNYGKYVTFLADVLAHFETNGKPFDFISPFNEPQWDWSSPNQEGTPYDNQDISTITRMLDSVISVSKLKTKIQIGEAGKFTYLYAAADKPARGNQLDAFFNNSSTLYIGNLSSLYKSISGHSYFTSAPADTLRTVRTNLSNKMRALSSPIEFWQSEYCILGDQEEIKAEGKDTGIDPALYVSRVIHHDLTVANASAWHWWLAVTPYDYKDGLIYVDKNENSGKIEDTKLLWAVGNFSRFIRPNAVRVNVTAENMNVDAADGLMVSSYVNEAQQELVIVAINYSDTDLESSLAIDEANVSTFKKYITGPGEDEKLKALGEVPSGEKLLLPKRSIVTLVGKIGN
jgi:O-glycosyl hydrolase